MHSSQAIDSYSATSSSSLFFLGLVADGEHRVTFPGASCCGGAAATDRAFFNFHQYRSYSCGDRRGPCSSLCFLDAFFSSPPGRRAAVESSIAAAVVMASIRRSGPLKGHFMVGKEQQHYAPSLLLDFRCRRSFVRALFLSFLAGFFWGLVSFPDLEGPTLSPPHGLFRDPDASSLNSISVEVEDVEEEVRSPFSKLLIIVTPTYNRAAQGYHLTRLAQTLRLVPPPLLWIVVEMKRATEETADVLRRSGVMYRHLVCRRNTSITLHRDVRQRHTALKHIKRHRLDGIVYFADDDNVYTLDLFRRLRQIRRFGTWPVAMLLQSKSKIAVEGPVCDGRRVVGWHINEKNTTLQRFPVDMSGFAFNSNILWHPKDAIRLLDTVTDDFEDTGFLEQIIEDEYQMEAVPRDCPRIMHWRLQLEAKHLAYPKGWKISKNLNGIIPLNQEF